MTRLPSLCLLMALTISVSLAAPTRGVVEVAIGEPHEIPVPVNVNISGPIDEPLPSWMVKEGDILKMIAPPDALPSYLVVMGELTMEIKVKENEPTGCRPSDEWADLLVDGAALDHWGTIKALEQREEVTMSNIRVVPRSYAKAYRKLTDESNDKGTETMVIIVKSECGQSVNPIIETMFDLFPESELSVVHGSILSRSTRNEDSNSILSSLDGASTDEPMGEELEMKKETTTLASTTTTRHTRATTAVSYVPIKAIRCTQGAYCVGELDEKTFFGGDGGVGTFDLKIEHLNGNGGVHPFVVKEGKKRSIGVIPLTEGEHTFRLRGMDKSKKPVTSPFSISVSHDQPINHQFKMTMHSLPHEPEYLHTTLKKLASALKRNVDEIKVANVTRLEGSRAVVTYWNTSLPTTSCPIKEVAQWVHRLHKGNEVAPEFAKQFQHHPTIHPDRIEVEWLGECEAAAAAAEGAVKTAGGIGGSSKQGEEPIAEETEGSLSTLITVVCLLALLLALLILIVCCVACRKGKTHKTGVNEYMSKGTPVVFPDEVEDEQEDVPASAPMLVKEERPPLRVSEHSNPLYKPPPPLASTAASPRPSAAPSAHKLPPPYVPP